ncbi:hypothetical protein [Nonomuraea sp. LPB2021202275-12-8]|uniref:hypothetical protein n=1 Tax=Nonomuraea sp. LPB2021202275-12-8 TaxID=3120159 RepID=UPI00300CB71C
MATENSGAPHLPPSWPEAPQREAPTSWPEPPQRDVPASWPQSAAGPQPEPSWAEPARDDVPTSWPQTAQPAQPSWPDATQAPQPSWPDTAQAPQPSWPETAHPSQPSWPETAPAPQPSWPDASQAVPPSWPETPQPNRGGRPDPSHPAQPSWPETAQPAQGGRPAQGAWPETPVQDPVPAWAEIPATPPPGAWANLSSPAPWPQQAPVSAPGAAYNPAPAPAHDRAAPYDQGASPLDGPAPYNQTAPPPDGRAPRHQAATPLDERAVPRGQGAPADDRTMMYAQPGVQPDGRVDERPAPDGGPPGEHQPGHARPGHNLSRDPSDPDRPFVTAGQISGSRTPPPERQQELWNTVFGDNYQEMGEPESLDEPGKPIWIYALAGSVAIALVAAVLWAFLAGPLAGEEPKSNIPDAKATTSAPATKKPTTSLGRLPTYRGKAAPVIGTVPDAPAGITVPRLGGTWRLDQRLTVKGTYGFDTRQYSLIDSDTAGQILTGPLPSRLSSSFTSADDLEPVIKAVVVDARKRFFPAGNKVRKIAQQPLKVGDATGRLIAYSLTSPTEKATIVTAAVNTGGDVPAIVYMSIPAEGKALLPDVNTVVKQLKLS